MGIKTHLFYTKIPIKPITNTRTCRLNLVLLPHTNAKLNIGSISEEMYIKPSYSILKHLLNPSYMMGFIHTCGLNFVLLPHTNAKLNIGSISDEIDLTAASRSNPCLCRDSTTGSPRSGACPHAWSCRWYIDGRWYIWYKRHISCMKIC
jgi:hypothetical protein